MRDEKSILHFGPSSVWTHARPDLWAQSASVPSTQSHSGLSPVNWSRHLPQSVPITQTQHDRAIQHFESFYSPWCNILDVHAFRREMATSNAEPVASPGLTIPIRTPNYSPLLHNSILYLGLFLARDEWPETMNAYEEVFMTHCSSFVQKETTGPTLSTLRALVVYSTYVPAEGLCIC